MAGKKYTPKRDVRHVAPPPQRPGPAPWQGSYGTHIAGSEVLDDLKAVTRQMDDKWGIGRLRLLVDAALREKFDRQRYKTNQAVWHGSLEDLRMQVSRMITALRKLDEVATASGAVRKVPEQWEAALDFGQVLVVVQHPDDVALVKDDGRSKSVWSLQEVARLIDGRLMELHAKAFFPGATIEGVDTVRSDPLNGLRTSLSDLDDDISDLPYDEPCPF